MEPFPTSRSFTFPPTADSSKLLTGDDTNESSMTMDEEKKGVRKAALELMISLSEAKPEMADAWAATIVRRCSVMMFGWKLTFALCRLK